MQVSNRCPINIPIETYRFQVIGKPWVQKNNLSIFYKNPRAKTGAFVGHSHEMSKARDRMSNEMYAQFLRQGGKMPIDCG